MKLTRILKEIFIIILLALAIVLILGVLFYNYIPTNKLLPGQVAYTPTKEVNELKEQAEAEENMQKVNLVYEVDASDLKVYQNSGSYNPGKVNPFANTSEDTSGTDNPQSGNSQSGSNTQTGGGTGNYYPSTGGK